jgi:hypothetical protein
MHDSSRPFWGLNDDAICNPSERRWLVRRFAFDSNLPFAHQAHLQRWFHDLFRPCSPRLQYVSKRFVHLMVTHMSPKVLMKCIFLRQTLKDIFRSCVSTCLRAITTIIISPCNIQQLLDKQCVSKLPMITKQNRRSSRGQEECKTPGGQANQRTIVFHAKRRGG